jgi:hypothetical protein
MINRNEIYTGLNQGIKEERGRVLRNNLGKNLSLVNSKGGLGGVTGDFRGKHVAVIGAGPSLDRNIPYLKKYKEDWISLSGC